MELNSLDVPRFQRKTVPAGNRLAGFAAIVKHFGMKIPVRRPTAVGEGHLKGGQKGQDGWRLLDARYWPGTTFAEHLEFALRHEDLDLLVIKKILEAAPAETVAAYVRSAPGGVNTRRAWFLYEWLLGKTLDLADLPKMNAVPLLDPAKYYASSGKPSSRHRVRNNLLGVAGSCAVIRRTEKLEALMAKGLGDKAQEIVGRTRAQLVMRAASFLLLADSRASFMIERESPMKSRLERWGRAVMEAGRHPLSLDEVMRLHDILIEDSRFVRPGLRTDGVFLGERDLDGDPLPEFVGARPADLPGLMADWLAANEAMRQSGIDPVLQAAATAFAFVYIHPFEDGNGRLHRCLIHHVLAERKFSPPGLLFPISAVMLDKIDRYRDVLRSHSGPLMDAIEWRTSSARNVEVLSDSADCYRYFDCTEAAEFLYECVERAVEKDLPEEIRFLRQRDEAARRVMERVEMPDDTAARLVRLIRENDGKLGKKRRENEFAKLSDEEARDIEAIVRDVYEED